MIKGCIFALLVAVVGVSAAAQDETVQERNKRLAREFYEYLWLSNNTDQYETYVADTYVVHDIGDRKNVTETAIQQKEIADFFWDNGEISGEIQYQIADGDLVATRWTVLMEPTTVLGSVMLDTGGTPLPIINVFRFNEDGKIVEVWNHRHDIDTPRTLQFTAKGFLFGLAVALVFLFWALSLRRRLKAALAE